MGLSRDSFSNPAAGEEFAPLATLRASDAPSCLGQIADPSVTQRLVSAMESKAGTTRYASGHTLATPSPWTRSKPDATPGPSKNCSDIRT